MNTNAMARATVRSPVLSCSLINRKLNSMISKTLNFLNQSNESKVMMYLIFDTFFDNAKLKVFLYCMILAKLHFWCAEVNYSNSHLYVN